MQQYQLPTNIRLTLHATQRASHRGVRRQAIAYALAHGKRTRCRNGMRIELRRHNIRPEDMADMHKAVGLVVVFDEIRRQIITLYTRYDDNQELSHKCQNESQYRKALRFLNRREGGK